MRPVVSPLDATGPETGPWCAIFAAGRAADSGSTVAAATLAADVRRRPAGPGVHRLAAITDDIGVVGAAECRRAGVEEVFTRLYVPEQHRRRGTGRALAGAVLEWSARVGASRVAAAVVTGSAGEPFAATLGARTVTRLVTVARDMSAPLTPAPLPAGLDAVRWTVACPEPWLASYTRIKRGILDAPGAALSISDPPWTPEAVRAFEARAEGTLHVCAAIDPGTGDLVGITEVIAPEAGAAGQVDTVVAPAWRGLGLGTFLKAEMVAWLRETHPAVDKITSTINERNAAMLAVSARAGYQIMFRRMLVMVDLDPFGSVPTAG